VQRRCKAHRIVSVAADQANPAMSHGQQVLDRGPRATRVVDAGRVEARSGEPEQADRAAEREEGVGFAVRQDETRDEKRVNALAHPHHGEEALPTVRISEVVQQQIEAARVQLRLGAGEELPVVPAIDERNDNADGGRATARQPGSERRRDVVQLARGDEDAVAGRRRYVGKAAQRPRDGRD
jgi:hypothetical protein